MRNGWVKGLPNLVLHKKMTSSGRGDDEVVAGVHLTSWWLGGELGTRKGKGRERGGGSGGEGTATVTGCFTSREEEV